MAPNYQDKGKVKVVYRHFAFIGPESEAAASASECAADQGKFWEYANYLFTHQAGENKGSFSRETLKKFADEVKLEMTAFNQCFDSNKHYPLVKQETEEGRQRGVRGTPTFFINGRKMEIDYNQLAAAVDAALPRQ